MDINTPELPSVVPASRVERIFFGLLVTILPVLAFYGGLAFGPEWQSGNFNDYITLLLNPKAALLFFPLLAYAVVALWLILFSPARFAAHFPVRLGIYTGVVLALQYLILSAISMFPSLIFGLIVAALYTLSKKVGRKFGPWPIVVLLMAVLLAADLVFGPFSFSSFADIPSALTTIPIFCLVFLAAASPLLSFLIMLTTALRLYRNYELPLVFGWAKTAGLSAWLGGYAIAWAYSIQEMFNLYAALPKSPPDCYIATAAAQGHPAFVHSRPVRLPSGSLWVNSQLQTLKCAELALLALAPGLLPDMAPPGRPGLPDS